MKFCGNQTYEAIHKGSDHTLANATLPNIDIELFFRDIHRILISSQYFG